MSLSEVLQLIFSITGAFALYILNDLKKSVDLATRSIADLNTRVGVIIARDEAHEKEIDRIKIDLEKTKDKTSEISNILEKICLQKGVRNVDV